LTSGAARAAFDLRREPDALRRRYGPGKWGQCVLLARRLVEAGVRLVHVNWPREGGDNSVDNPMWDTHAQNSDRLQDVLCPQFDVGFTALIEDLDSRGLLDETLVVAIGEFGRTPKINKYGGRDHWGHVFSFVMAGAGIRTAQVYGSSDALGGHPKSNKVEPPDLTATIFHLLGIGHDAFFPDPTGRPIRVAEGEPIRGILGNTPATPARSTPGGDLAFVPAYSDDLLLDTRFEPPARLVAVGSGRRLKGWQASPFGDGPGLSVRLAGGEGAGLGHARIVLAPGGTVAPGARAMLTQEVRNPRAGRYLMTVRAGGGGTSAGAFRDLFLKHFACRMVLYGFLEMTKDPNKVREFASVAIVPEFAAGGSPKVRRSPPFSLTAVLKGQDDSARQINMGVGVALVVERTTPGTLEIAEEVYLRIDEVELLFNPRPRNDEVTV
jgi:hypothetical protein